MMDLKINKTSELSFKLNIQGSTAPPKARLVFKMNENSELAINGKVVENGRVKVEIPPLVDLKEKFNSNITHAYLEVIIDENYFKPWEGEFNFKQPLVVTAESEEDVSEEPIKENKVSIEIEDLKEKEEEEPITPIKEAKKDNTPPDGTGPHGKGDGPGKGKADGSGMKNDVLKDPEEPEPEPKKKERKDYSKIDFTNTTLSADEYIRRRLGEI